jgi:hypothetical protein
MDLYLSIWFEVYQAAGKKKSQVEINPKPSYTEMRRKI